MPSISPTQSNAQAALRAFLLAVLPGLPGVAPAVFVGTIAGATLNVTSVVSGAIAIGAPVLGAAPGTVIQAFDSGTGATGTYTVSVSQTLGNATTMATGVAVVAGQANRAPEPANPWFVVMTPIRFPRLATNVDASADTKFIGSIAGITLTVSAVATGSIQAGAIVFGPSVAAGTSVQWQLTGAPGGDGTYQVSVSQTVSSSTLSAGTKTLTQEAEAVVQLDFHSPDTTAGDFAQTVSALLRDEYGVNFFAALAAPLSGVAPLHADDPAQRPFINDQSQYEWRWVLVAHLQINQAVSAPQTYADSATVSLEVITNG